MIYLKLYTKDKDYQDVLSAGQLLLPNVSHTIDANEVYYNPIQGANEIWYTSVNGGKVYVNPDSFSGATGELLTVQSHIYADGIGRILFNDDVVSIGQSAFYEEPAPQSINDEDTPVVANVATYRLSSQNYDDILTITFPDGVKELKGYALNGSSYLTEINIPKTVANIEDYAIPENIALNKINIAPNNTAFSSKGNCLIELSTGCLLKGTNTSMIPNNVKGIYNYAFCNCTGLTEIAIPESVTFIGLSAFSNCTRLAKITIPESVIAINYSAFYLCESLQSITILATIPPTLSTSVFEFINSSAKIYVPSESVDAYKTATNWSKYASMIQSIG